MKPLVAKGVLRERQRRRPWPRSAWASGMPLFGF
jgi:hypothetical protein